MFDGKVRVSIDRVRVSIERVRMRDRVSHHQGCGCLDRVRGSIKRVRGSVERVRVEASYLLSNAPSGLRVPSAKRTIELPSCNRFTHVSVT